LQGIGLAAIPLGPAFAYAAWLLMQECHNPINSYRPPMYFHFVLQAFIAMSILSVPVGIGMVCAGRRLLRR
jgi:hypothetical protein